MKKKMLNKCNIVATVTITILKAYIEKLDF